MTLIERIASLVLAFDSRDLPQDVEEQAKKIILDSLACALAASTEETARATLETVENLGGVQQCTIIGRTQRTSVPNAVLANGVLIRTLDLNDLYWGPNSGGHPSDNVAVALAAGERQGSSGRDILVSLVLGYELYCRIQDLVDPASPWDHVTASGLAAPAIAGRLLGLSAEQLADALALSVTHCNTLGGIRRGQISAAKSVANAIVAHTGILVTMLAAQGLSGPRTIMEDQHGWGRAVMPGADLGKLVAPMDGRFRLMEASIKAYPCVGTAQAAVAAALEARSALGDAAGHAEHVELRMADLPVVRDQVLDTARRRPASRETADHSFYYLVAVALLDGELTPRQFLGERWRDPAVQALMDAIVIQTDAGLNVYTPGSFPCVLRLATSSGRTFTAEVPYPPGHPRNRLSAAGVRDKFIHYAGAETSETQRAGIFGQVESFQELRGIRGLMDYLAGSVPETSAPGH